MSNLTPAVQALLPDSVLPSPIRTQRFLILESLLKRLDGLAVNTLVMLIDRVPTDALIFLAEHFSLFADGWEFAKNDIEQRELIKAAIEIHRHKGTPWAIKRTLKLLGYGDCELVERYGYNEHDATINHDGIHSYSSEGSWTHYRLIMPYMISRDEAENIRTLLKDVAPLRCLLVAIKVPLVHDATIKHNSQYRYNGDILWLAN